MAKIKSEADTVDGLTVRLLMALVTEQVQAEARVANSGIIVRTLAAEYGVRVPEPEEVE